MLHGLGIDKRLERGVVVGQRWKFVGHFGEFSFDWNCTVGVQPSVSRERNRGGNEGGKANFSHTRRGAYVWMDAGWEWLGSRKDREPGPGKRE
jgi:hypothetical protein